MAATALLVALGATAHAYSCSEPSAPYCATQYGAFDDEDDFDNCRREMESYRDEVQDYQRCLARQGQQAVDELNSAIDSFNRRARGG
jgi:hypothetical protein